MRSILAALCAAAAVTAATLVALEPAGADPDPSPAYDLVVYGATPSGVTAAVQAARQGERVALVEPGHWIGGMVTGGLSHTDIGTSPSVIGGLPREFFRRVAAEYKKTEQWDIEPKVALKVMTQMLTESGVAVFTDDPLQRDGGVGKVGTVVTSITTVKGDVFTAREFVDAGYEGDLMAAAGVTYAVGRESTAQYGESMAGVRPFTTEYRTPTLPAVDADGNAYPEIDTTTPPAVGSADNHVQPYNYRLTVTNKATNRVPFPMPPDYDPHRFALLASWLPRLQATLGRPLVARDVLTLTAMPNSKYDLNNNGPFSTDYLNGSFGYSDAGDDTRAAIAQQTKNYDEGLLYFLQNDPQVPTSLHNDIANYGLAKDEFVDNGNWPTQLYVREARRMVGSFVLRQQDLQSWRARPDIVAQGSYRIDQHSAFRGVDATGTVRNEGAFSLASKSPYPIPYGVIVPRAGEATNLLVTGALSATHVAWSSIRMEPQFMMLGQAAGDAAALAIKSGTAVQDVSVTDLTGQLAQQNAVLPASSIPAPVASTPASTPTSTAPTTAAQTTPASVAPSSEPSPTDSGVTTAPAAATTPTAPVSTPSTTATTTPATVTVDNTDSGFTATAGWTASSSTSGFLGTNYAHNNAATDGRAATWTPALPTSGTWTVYARWTAHTNRSAAATYTVSTSTGSTTVVVDQRVNGSSWFPLAMVNVADAGSVRVSLTNGRTGGYVIADAVRFVSG